MFDGKNRNIDLEDLFRSKLNEEEVIPDPSVSMRLMKKVARREFTSFNPVRFNIYYLGGIVAAGIAAAFIFFSAGNAETSDLRENTVNVIQAGEPENNKTAEPEENSLTESPVPVTGEIRVQEEVKKVAEKASGREAGRKVTDYEGIGKTDIQSRVPVKELVKVDTDSHNKLVVNSKDIYGFVSSVTEGCVPLGVKFICTSLDIDSCLWIFGDGGTAAGRSAEWIYDVDGDYNVTLQIYSGGSLVRTLSEVISVYPRPVASFEINPESPAIPDEEVQFLNYSTGAVSCIWDFGDGNVSELLEPLHRYEKYGSYDVQLTVFNEYGCSDSVFVSNAFSGSGYFIEFPNAFIPNTNGPSGGYYTSKSDESAQVFHPVFSGVSEYQLRIFSKMGIMIFESNDINIGWDGYFKGQLSNSGVYIWKVRGKYRNGEPFTMMGDVTLLNSKTP